MLGVVGAFVIAATTPNWRLSGKSWRLTVVGLPHDGSRPSTAVLFFAGLGLLCVGWIWLIRWAEQSTRPERQRTRIVVMVAALWFVPVLLGPPLLSTDVYSYAAQGEMLSKGFDPASEPMSKLHYGTLAHVEPFWRNTDGNPYGPVQLEVSSLVVDATSSSMDATALAFRLVAVGGLLASVWGISSLARRYGATPPLAVAIGIANPIAVIHTVGGGHNDSLLMALTVTGCALAAKGRFHLGVLVLALATAVKLPGAAAIIYVAWNRHAVAAVAQRVRTVVSAIVMSSAAILGVGAVFGVGAGWVLATRNAGTVKGTWSLPTHLGYVVHDILRTLGLRLNTDTVVGATRAVGLLGSIVLCLLLLRKHDKLLPPAAIGLAMAAVVLLGPVVWPWYFATPIALLGSTALGRWRSAFFIACIAMSAQVYSVGTSAKPMFESNHLAATVGLLAIGATCVAVVARRDEPSSRIPAAAVSNVEGVS